jgi:uracil-DNA glycosylase family 4
MDTTRSYTSVAETHNRTLVREQVRQCTSCTFCYNGNGPVLPSGPTPNDVMILGDAPTRSDDRAGHVTFKGDPGLLLRRLLARVDLDLDTLFFVNSIQCWPEAGITDRSLVACTKNLKALLGTCDPKIVLALGAVALKVTSDRRGRTITKDHGIPFQPKAGPFMGRWVFPTWHPAALKHTASAEIALSADIVTFAQFYTEEVRGT